MNVCMYECILGDIKNGFAFCRPPGHHACRTHTGGYCLLNNVAITAMYAINHFNMDRVVIIDWDIHHGKIYSSEYYTIYSSNICMYLLVHLDNILY
jgi:acetoin utilization deacetylase AcuC-like enzyme